MAGAAVWQRLTGPTYPKRARVELAGQELRLRLLRSFVAGEPLPVSVSAPEGVSGVVRYRRYPTDEPFRDVPLRREGGALAALLPTQPPAGKLEYSVVLEAGGRTVSVPAEGPVVMRFKGDVPAGVLVPHVVFMFFGMMIGQKYAFGAYWTGWPFGEDLTDNKTLAMWLAWVVAVVVLGRRRDPADRLARWTVAAAAAVTIAVYLVPHSLRGSQLDYGKLEGGAAAKDAIGTGR